MIAKMQAVTHTLVVVDPQKKAVWTALVTLQLHVKSFDTYFCRLLVKGHLSPAVTYVHRIWLSA